MTATGRIYFCLLGRDKLNSVWKIFVFAPCISVVSRFFRTLVCNENATNKSNKA